MTQGTLLSEHFCSNDDNSLGIHYTCWRKWEWPILRTIRNDHFSFIIFVKCYTKMGERRNHTNCTN